MKLFNFFKTKDIETHFRIISPFTLDLSEYHHSLNYFIRAIANFDHTLPQKYQDIMKDLIFIHASDSKDGQMEGVEIQAIYEPSKISAQEIQNRLKNIGIETEIVEKSA